MRKIILSFFFVLSFFSTAFSQSITVTSPNGGESWNSCTSKAITWSSTGTTTNLFNIYYSLDNGANWVSIATSYNTTGGTFTWTEVPNVSSVNCLIRVEYASNTSVKDQSNGTFTINGSLIVLTPNGGESLIAGNTYNVTYSYIASAVSSVKIEYSFDAGSNWQTVIATTTATGSYSWTVPNTPANVCKMRISDATTPSCKKDTSDGYFTILSSVTVTYPNTVVSVKANVSNQGVSYLMSNTPVKLNTGNFYDDGGLNTNYSNFGYTKTFTPDNPLNKLQVTFQNYNLETNDLLYIYNGPNTSGTLLATISGSNATNVSYVSTHYTGALTFVYQSDGDAIQSTGWDAYLLSIGTTPTNLTWSIVGTSKFFNIDYTTNNGSNWVRIINNYFTVSGSFPWQIPNTVSANCKIRITDANNSNISDISDTVFSITDADPIVTLFTPNTFLSIYPTTVYSILWSSLFAGTNIALDYSTNGGVSWTNIISSYPNSAEAYNWTVPFENSTQCRVRIRDLTNFINDSSDVNFTINRNITIQSPNGGNSFTKCSQQTITWTGGGNSGNYSIDYSTNAGVTFTNITNSATGTSYVWTLPNIVSNNYLIRVKDVVNSTKSDTSNTVFSVTNPPVVCKIISPNGGQIWTAGTPQSITYSYPSGTTSITLQYSINNGNTWQNINAGITPNGSESWIVPNYATTQALIRIINNTANVCDDVDSSDSVFTILSSTTVTQPNGGENWQATVGSQGTNLNMSNATIVCNTGNYYDQGGIAGNTNNTNYTQTLVPDNPLNKLSITFDDYSFYNAYVNSPVYSQQYDYLYIYNGPNTSGSLLGTLSGNASGTATFTSTHASGALTFVFQKNSYLTGGNASGFKARFNSVGTSTKNLSWNIIGTSKIFNLEYSTNNGTSWTRIVTEYPSTNGIFPWQVPNTPSGNCLVRVIDAGNNQIIDSSNSVFSITSVSPVMIVAAPNGGENVYPTQSYPISWYSGFAGGLVNIDLSLNGGTSWSSIATNQANNVGGLTPTQGIYNWTVPYTLSNTAKIRITDAGNSSTSDTSNANFSIKNNFTINTPATSQSIVRCSNISINWSAQNTSGNYTVEYSLNNGTTWTTISTTATGTSLSWTLPNTVSSQTRIRITDNSDNAKTNTSGTFNITPPASTVQLLSPNGGQVWTAGTSQTITYTYPAGTTSIHIMLSTNGGASYNYIATGITPNGAYTWTVDNKPSAQAVIKIVNATAGVCDEDTSDAVFTILSSVTVIQPNGGENWQATVGSQGTNLNMSNATIVCNTGNYYDQGGIAGNTNNTNYTQTLVPDNPLNKLSITFDDYSFYNAYVNSPVYSQQYDYLYIYNGPNTSGSLLGTLSGNASGTATFTSTHASGALTFVFQKNSYLTGGNASGFKARFNSVGTSTKNLSWNIIGTSKIFNLEYSTNNGTSWTRIVTEYPSTNGIFPWQVPNTPSGNCLVRVIDAGNNQIIDSSNSVFSITSVSPVMIVAAPNGGENVYPTQSYPISWYSGFAGGLVNIDLSLNGGTSWSSIATNQANNVGGLTPTQGIYNWTVPYTLSNTAKIRITDAGNSSTSDTSNANFSIKNNFTINTPATSQSIVRCSNISINWSAQNTSGNYTVEYSLNNGTTWTTISTTATGTSLSWTLPNTVSSQARIRITDNSDNAKTNTSGTFNITPPASTVQLLSPNGGQVWTAGTSQTITYTYPAGTTSIHIMLSTNGGISYSYIATGITPNGAYTWTVDNKPSAQAVIKIVNATAGVCDEDTSDAVFTILSSVTVIQPNGGENWQATVGSQGTNLNMSNATIVCNTGNYYDQGGIAGNTNNTNYTQTLVPDNPLNKLSITFDDYSFYNAYVNSPVYSQQYDYLYIYNGPNTSGSLLGTLSGNASGTATFTSTHASGALTFVFQKNSYLTGGNASGFKARFNSVGTSTKNLSWNIIGTSKIFNLEYSTNNGTSWTRIVTEYPSTNGIFPWQVPNTPSGNCLVRVIDAGNNQIIDSSNSVFSITSVSPVMIVAAPNGGENVYPTQSYPISWYSGFAGGLVNIDLSLNGGTSWSSIATNQANNVGGLTPTQGIYNWTVPYTLSNTAKIRITDAGNSSTSDTSNANFSIKNNFTINTPATSQSIVRCSNISINWSAQNTSGNYTVEYSLNNGTTWTTISTTATGTSLSWTLPNTVSTQARIRITDNSDNAKTNTSGTFNITPPASTVQLLSPNGGQVWTAGTSQTITYTYPAGTTSIHIMLSTNGGISYSYIATGITPNGAYTWTVDNKPSAQAVIKIVNATAGVCDEDTSDAVFTILSSVTVIQPNGGENWQATVGSQGTNLNMSNATIVCNTGNYYDQGGIAGNTNNTNYTQTLVPDNPLNKLSITFDDYSFYNAYVNSPVYSQQYDYLYIYNGPNTSGSLLGTLSGNASGTATFTSTHASGALTFVFQKNSYLTGGNASGFKARFNSVGTSTKNLSWNIIGTSKIFNLEYSTNNGNSWTRIVTEYPSTNGIFPWQVPNTPSGNCLVRVIDAGNNQIIDSSNSVFSITSVSPVMIVAAPNGGENVYPTQSYPISWYSGFAGGLVNIDLSLNGGTSWSSIATNQANNVGGLTPTQGIYNWTVPYTLSNTAKIRITDAGNSSTSDTSNANFSIKNNFTINTPATSQSIVRCSNISINWSAQNTSGNYTVEYSLNNGTTWTTISTTATGTSLSWTLPNTVSTQARIRITDNSDNAKTNTSGTFNITPPASTVQLLSPNGGQVWTAGTSQTISYSYPAGTTGISLYYSIDSGLTYTAIITNQTPNGAYTWNVANFPSNTVFMKVVNATSNVCDEDISNGTFTIVSYVTVTQPNGGESWQAMVGNQGINVNMSNANITCNTAGFYDQGGIAGPTTSVNYTQTFTPDHPNNKLSVNFDDYNLGNQYINSPVYSTQYDQLIIYNGPNTASPVLGTLTGASSGITTFTSTHATGTLTFAFVKNSYLSSVNGTGWKARISSIGTQTKNITWNITGTSNKYNIDYSINGGSNWSRIVTEFPSNTGVYAWQVPNTPSTNCRVKVMDALNNAIIDSSDAPFTIGAATPYLRVDYPNGGSGQRLYTNQAITILWSSTMFNVPSVRIEYTINNGITWTSIVNAVTNNGSYVWNIPTITKVYNSCRIRICNSAALYQYDISDNTFELRPGIVIVSPNNNSTAFQACTQSSITFEAGAPNSNSFKIDLSNDSGATWVTQIANYSNATFNGNYTWTIPNTPGTRCLIKVTDNNNATYTDISDSIFTITPSIEVIHPTFGGMYQTGTVLPITWYQSNTSNYYNIDYSINGGTSWTNVITNVQILNGTYNWTVPAAAASSNVIIRVSDYLNTCKSDISDKPFTVATTTPVVKLTNINSGSHTGCAAKNITWTVNGVSNVNILFSPNAARTWNLIASNYATSSSGSYSWTVPNFATTQGLLKVVDAANPNNYDVSDSLFTIIPSITVSIVSNRSSNTICSGDTVTLTSSSSSGNLWSTGATTQSIKVTTNGTYFCSVASGGCTAVSNSIPITVLTAAGTPYITASGPTTFCTGGNVILTSSSIDGNVWLPTGETTQSILVSTGGVYAVMGANSNGCFATSSTITVDVSPIPQAPVINSNSPVIAGDTIKLFSNYLSGATYAWTGPNGFTSSLQNPYILNASASKAGAYLLTITASGGCPSPQSSTIVTVASSGSIVVSGTIRNAKGEPVQNVKLLSTGTNSTNTLTNVNGDYSLNLLQGGTYTITPSKNNDGNRTNGVSTLDIALIQSHILKTDTLRVLKLLAADVNGNNSVTTADLVYMRRLILGTDTTFPGGKLWNFLSTNYYFNDTINPFPYDNVKQYFSISSSQNNQNFTAIKLGDVSWDWNPAISLIGTEALILYYDTIYSNQDSIRIKVRVRNFKNLIGLQNTLTFNSKVFSFAKIENNLLNISFGTSFVNKGQLNMLWNAVNNVASTLTDETVLFDLVLNKKSPFTNEDIKITSDYTTIEAYNGDWEKVDIVKGNGAILPEVVENGITEKNNPVQLEAYPNPASDQLFLNIDVLKGKLYTVYVYDINGKMVKSIPNYRNLNALDVSELSVGVYAVSVKYGSSVAQKMIRVIR